MKYVGPLKHYRRKRFLHKFLMMDSPRSACLVGLGTLFLAVLLRSFGHVTLILMVAACFCSRTAALVSGAVLITLFTVMMIAAGAFFGSGKYNGIRRWQLRDLLTVGHWKKCWSVIFVVFAALLLIVGGNSVPVLAAVLLCLVLLFVFAPDDRKIKGASLIPVLLALLMLAGMFCAVRVLERETRLGLVRLAWLIDADAPVSVEEYDAREAGGLSLRQEPWKSMKGLDTGTSPFVPYRTPEEARNVLDDLRRKNPHDFAAMEHFLTLPVGFIREEYVPASNRYESRCGVLREAARIQALMMQSARDREAVVRADAALRKLRDWSLASHSASARLVAVSIETVRLRTLAGTLPRMNWSGEEYASLLGDAPDWDTAFLRAIGDDTLQGFCLDSDMIAEVHAANPWGLYFLLDMHHTVARSVKVAEIAMKKELPYSARREAIRKLDAPAGFLYADLRGGWNELLWRHFVRIQDLRVMAEAAFDIFAESRKTGTPPDRPRWLHGLRDRWENRAFGYEFGEIAVAEGIQRRGFRIFFDDPEKKQREAGDIAVLW